MDDEIILPQLYMWKFKHCTNRHTHTHTHIPKWYTSLEEILSITVIKACYALPKGI